MEETNLSRTRDLCNNLSKILNLSPLTLHNFTSVIESALVHKALCEYLENGSMRISVPFICDMYVGLDENDNVVINDIVLDNVFKTHISKAVKTGQSPFILDAESSLIRRIRDKYESLV